VLHACFVVLKLVLCYHFDQPGRDDVLVMQSRLDSRARWASQLARDAGWKQ
jgi:hypothetical protein